MGLGAGELDRLGTIPGGEGTGGVLPIIPDASEYQTKHPGNEKNADARTDSTKVPIKGAARD